MTWRGGGAHLLAQLTGGGLSLLQLYSVYLDGYLFCRVRYSQLRRWNEQVSRFEAAECSPDAGLLEDSKFLVCNLVSLGVPLHVYRWPLLTIYSWEMRESGSGPSPKLFSAQRFPSGPTWQGAGRWWAPFQCQLFPQDNVPIQNEHTQPRPRCLSDLVHRYLIFFLPEFLGLLKKVCLFCFQKLYL